MSHSFTNIRQLLLTCTELDTGIAQLAAIGKWQTLVEAKYTLILHHAGYGASQCTARGLHTRFNELDGVRKVDGKCGREATAPHRL